MAGAVRKCVAFVGVLVGAVGGLTAFAPPAAVAVNGGVVVMATVVDTYGSDQGLAYNSGHLTVADLQPSGGTTLTRISTTAPYSTASLSQVGNNVEQPVYDAHGTLWALECDQSGYGHILERTGGGVQSDFLPIAPNGGQAIGSCGAGTAFTVDPTGHFAYALEGYDLANNGWAGLEMMPLTGPAKGTADYYPTWTRGSADYSYVEPALAMRGNYLFANGQGDSEAGITGIRQYSVTSERFGPYGGCDPDGLPSCVDDPSYSGGAGGTQLYNVRALTVDGAGDLFVAEGGWYTGSGHSPYTIRKITPQGTISTVAGGGAADPSLGASPTQTQLPQIEGLANDGTNVYALGQDGQVILIPGVASAHPRSCVPTPFGCVEKPSDPRTAPGVSGCTYAPPGGGQSAHLFIQGSNLDGLDSVTYEQNTQSTTLQLDAGNLTQTAPDQYSVADDSMDGGNFANAVFGFDSGATATVDDCPIASKALPVVRSVHASGGTATIDGSGMATVDAVEFGHATADAATITHVASNALTVKIPSQSPQDTLGEVHVGVHNGKGWSNAWSSDVFQYPQVNAVDLSNGTVTIHGTALGSASAVVFGTNGTVPPSSVTASTVTAPVPQLAPGSDPQVVTVAIQTPYGLTAGAGVSCSDPSSDPSKCISLTAPPPAPQTKPVSDSYDDGQAPTITSVTTGTSTPHQAMIGDSIRIDGAHLLSADTQIHFVVENVGFDGNPGSLAQCPIDSCIELDPNDTARINNNDIYVSVPNSLVTKSDHATPYAVCIDKADTTDGSACWWQTPLKVWTNPDAVIAFMSLDGTVVPAAQVSPRNGEMDFTSFCDAGSSASHFSSRDFAITAAITADGRVIAAGAGNVIAAGAGNVIAAGAGNVIAAGSGNVIAAGAGNVINAGAYNFRVVSNAPVLASLNEAGILVPQAAALTANVPGNLGALPGVIAAGAGNFRIASFGEPSAIIASDANGTLSSFQPGPGSPVIAAGAGNLRALQAGAVIAAGAGNVIAAGAGNVVAAGAGNLVGPGHVNLNNLIAIGNNLGLLANGVDWDAALAGVINAGAHN